MGDYKGHCLICDSYSSSVQVAWDRGEGCPCCGGTCSDSNLILKAEEAKKIWAKTTLDNKAKDRLLFLEIENATLRVLVDNLYNDFNYSKIALDDYVEKKEAFDKKVFELKSRLSKKE